MKWGACLRPLFLFPVGTCNLHVMPSMRCCAISQSLHLAHNMTDWLTGPW